MGVCFYLAGRGLYAPALAALDLVRVTPLPESYAWPAWWPKAWTDSYRLVMRAYNSAGEFVSIHGRSIVPGLNPKTRWPKGYAAGYLFADRRGAEFLRGNVGDTDRVIIVEGMTDTVAMALMVADAGRTDAVLGISSGSTKTLADVMWKTGIPVVSLMDPDEAGEKYAQEIRAAIPKGVDLRRARLPMPLEKAASK
jgi:5S rRNA maturation endonuclease (ribonuclease M5)